MSCTGIKTAGMGTTGGNAAFGATSNMVSCTAPATPTSTTGVVQSTTYIYAVT